MILALAFLAGAGLGALRARRAGGGAADMAQYAAAHGFAALVAVAALALIWGLFMGATA